jgi:hypothetical protein
MSNTVVHGLSIFKVKGGLHKIRSTIRTGQVKPDQTLSFTTSSGEVHTLKVRECMDGPGRHKTIIVEGDADAINEYKGGYYLFGE